MGCILYLYPQSQWGLGRGLSLSASSSDLVSIWAIQVRRLTLPLLHLSHCCCCFCYCSSCCLWNGNVNNAFCLSISRRRGCATVAADYFPGYGCVCVSVCLCVLCKLIFLFSSFVNWQIDIVYGMGYPHADWPLYESSISIDYAEYKKCFPKNTMHDNKWSRWFIGATHRKVNIYVDWAEIYNTLKEKTFEYRHLLNNVFN